MKWLERGRMGDIDGDHDRDGRSLNPTFVILLSPGEK